MKQGVEDVEEVEEAAGVATRRDQIGRNNRDRAPSLPSALSRRLLRAGTSDTLKEALGRGEVSERLKEPASKAGSLAKLGSWVRIPPSPPYL